MRRSRPPVVDDRTSRISSREPSVIRASKRSSCVSTALAGARQQRRSCTTRSGGYYVAAAADRIVSQPATITGSIGVIITSLDTQGLQDKIGVRQRVIKSGLYKDILNKDILTANRDLTPEEQAILNTLVQQTLDQFVSAVANGRNLPEAQVRQIADGRVVTGTEAQRLHLVDEVGDQERAVELAAQLAKLPPKPRVVVYEPSSAGGLLGLLGSLSDNLSGKAVLDQLGSGVRYEWRGE